MKSTKNRLFSSMALLGFTAVMAQAQISDVSAWSRYNNSQTGDDVAGQFEFNSQQESDVEPNPPTGFLQSPSSDVIFGSYSNPNQYGEMNSYSLISASLVSSSTHAILNGWGLAECQSYSTDTSSQYLAGASADEQLSLHLSGAGFVSFSLDHASASGFQDQLDYGFIDLFIDGSQVGQFTGDTHWGEALSAGDHTFDVYYNSQTAAGALASLNTASAGGNFQLEVGARPVPEPASLSALALGLGVFCRRARGRKNRATNV